MLKSIGCDFYVNLFVKAFLAVFSLVLLSLFYMMGWGGGGLSYDLNVIHMLSLMWFVFFLVIGSVSERLFWQFAPFVIFFTPNAVNDFWPSSPMALGENSPWFSFFTHVDIYLLLGVLAYCDFQKSRPKGELFVMLFLLLSLLSVFLVAVFRGAFWHALQGSYQLRYLIYLFVLFVYANPVGYQKEFASALKVVLVFVIAEAVIFSFVSGAVRLTSGNYGVNALGHLMAAGAAFLVVQRGERGARFFNYILIFVLFFAVLATSTRFSLVALLGALSMIYFLKSGRLSSLVLGLLLLIFALAVFLFFFPAGVSMGKGLLEVVQNISDPSAASVTPESSSMITRLRLWWATLEMIGDNPWVGVGPGVWAFLKSSYGIEFEAVLDPHQDILNYLVSYGVVLGVGFFGAVFVLPIFKALKVNVENELLWGWLAIVLVFMFAGITNAVTWKHQISVLAYFSSLMVFFGKSCPVRNHA